MKKILNYIWRGWFFLLAFCLLIICFLPVYLLSFRTKDYRAAYIFIRFWCICVFYAMGFRYKMNFKTEKRPDKKRQYIIVCNHTSMMDILLMPILFPNHPLCFIGKKELVKIPIFGTIYKRICVMVDRKSPKSRAEVYKRSAERIADGDSLVIFPEGGVSDDTSVLLADFKDGAFVMARNHEIPIVVLAFGGLKEMFPFDNSKGFPGVVHVDFLDILEPAESAVILKNTAYTEIKNALLQYYHIK